MNSSMSVKEKLKGISKVLGISSKKPKQVDGVVDEIAPININRTDLDREFSSQLFREDSTSLPASSYGQAAASQLQPELNWKYSDSSARDALEGVQRVYGLELVRELPDPPDSSDPENVYEELKTLARNEEELLRMKEQYMKETKDMTSDNNEKDVKNEQRSINADLKEDVGLDFRSPRFGVMRNLQSYYSENVPPEVVGGAVSRERRQSDATTKTSFSADFNIEPPTFDDSAKTLNYSEMPAWKRRLVEKHKQALLQ